MRATDRCDDCVEHHPGAAARFCSVCGRRLDVDGDHAVVEHVAPPVVGRQDAIVRAFVVASLVLLGVAAVVVWRLTGDEGGDPPQGGAAPSPSPATAVATPESAWSDVAAGLAPTTPQTEVTEIDGVPTVVVLDGGRPIVWRWLAGAWQDAPVPMASAATGTSITGDLVQLVEATGDGHWDAAISTSGTTGRFTALLTSHGGGWRSVPFEDGERWGAGVVVDDGRLAVDPGCGGPCAAGAPAGPWFRYDGATGSLASTEEEPGRPLGAQQVADAVEALEAVVRAEVGTDAPLRCQLPEVVAPGTELRCTLQEETPRLVEVTVQPDGTFAHEVGDPFEMR